MEVLRDLTERERERERYIYIYIYIYICTGLSQIRGTYFGGPYNMDYSIWGCILGSPYFGKLVYIDIWIVDFPVSYMGTTLGMYCEVSAD